MAAVQIVRFGVNAPEAEKGKPGNIISGAPQTSVQNYCTDKGGEFFSGIWESTPGKWSISYTEDEFCIILEGRVTLTDESGKAQTFKAGDAFVIPAGFKGTWETVEKVRKCYAISERKG
jgi:uncharacterized cupin superfamily protein